MILSFANQGYRLTRALIGVEKNTISQQLALSENNRKQSFTHSKSFAMPTSPFGLSGDPKVLI